MMRGLVRSSISNASALNLCMLAVLAVGWYCMGAMRRESFPEFDLDRILVTVPYLERSAGSGGRRGAED